MNLCPKNNQKVDEPQMWFISRSEEKKEVKKTQVKGREKKKRKTIREDAKPV
jgi:hypothetical protein